MRGIDSKHEHAAQDVARDTRPLGTKVAEFFSSPITLSFVFSFSIFFIFYISHFADLIFLLNLFLLIFASTRKVTLPFRMPESIKLLDHNDPKPGSGKPYLSRGIAFFGNELETSQELWFNNDDMRTHVLIFGSTGSGKTEALVSLAFNSLVFGSGFIYIDGKGDNSLFSKVFSMVRKMGREDDLLLINFMTGARDIIGPQESRLSNTMNPFAHGSSSMISQLVVSLMDSSKEGGNGDMWKGRAIVFVESLMKILCAMRDQGHILLDANTIRQYFILDKLEIIALDLKFPTPDGKEIPITGIPDTVLEPIQNYLYNLPGFTVSNKGKQAGEVREQHGFITMQLTRAFGSLADAYGHIIRTNLAEVDFKDVVLNRRILVVLLPALEKSPEELANLGKIIVASLKIMMAGGLGDAVEGDYRDVVLRKPTNSPTPYVCIMDEYGYYAVPGFAVVPAQARSLGFSAIFAGQDLPAFQKASKEEAASIVANTNIKICMKLEDPHETWELFKKTADEAYVTNVSGFQVNSDSLTMNYLDNKSTNVDRRQRIELLDLKDQGPGEMHIFFKSTIVRASAFFANPSPVQKMRINHFLKVNAPEPEIIEGIKETAERFSDVIGDPNYQFNLPEESEEINLLQKSFIKSLDMSAIDQSVVSVIDILDKEVAENKAEEKKVEQSSVNSIFATIPMTDIARELVPKSEYSLFSSPLVSLPDLISNSIAIESMLGSTSRGSKQVTNMMKELIISKTKYPPDGLTGLVDKSNLVEDLKELISMLGGDPGTAKPVLDEPTIPALTDDFNLDDIDFDKLDLDELFKELDKVTKKEDQD